MWFRFPEGCDRISVERQQFTTEVSDENGRAYFRAPDHFAPIILSIRGFSLASDLPEGAPPDLPQADPLRDGAISQLTKEQEALKIEVQNLRSDLTSARAQAMALAHENSALSAKLARVDVGLMLIHQGELTVSVLRQELGLSSLDDIDDEEDEKPKAR